MPEVRGGVREKRPHAPEIRCGSRKCQAVTVQEQRRGDTPHPSSGTAAGRRFPMSEFRGGGREEVPQARVQGQRLRKATPRRGSCGWAGAGGPRGATPRSRSGGCCEEIPLVQDKEQQLCFAVAALKRYIMSKVRETQIRW